MYLKKITWEDKRELPSLTIHVLATLSPLQASRISLLFLVPAMYVITLQCNELTTGVRESLKLKVTVLVFDWPTNYRSQTSLLRVVFHWLMNCRS